ncbi:MAG: septal ring lytic transglycosylase RlpA family protein [Candidatus Obscuribacterales bacterium]|nr:septal ring lytic transglycosylase RlpA family protein [Candidatus Obscuribacterales bacterium]
MTAEPAQQQTAATERIPAPAASENIDFSPPRENTWSGIASQCWSGDLKGCFASAGQKIGDVLGLGNAKEQDLIRRGTIPDISISQTGADTRPGTEAGRESSDLPKALQGDNRKRTETLMDAKAEPKERLKAASELVKAGITNFTVQAADGSINKVRLEKEATGNGRNMLGVYVSGKNGAELNALRAIQNADGSLVRQMDAGGKPVDYKNRGHALLDRLSTMGKVVPDETISGGKPAINAEPAPREKDRKPQTERSRVADEKLEPGQWKSPFERRYQQGDRFKGITSVYWEDSQTASGLRFKKDELTAASREFPFGTVLKVRNPETGLETRVVITDNGPFAGKKEARPDGSERIYNRVLDISSGAARAIGMVDTKPRAMEISVESIPEGRAWGPARTNLKRDQREEMLAQIKRIMADRRA